MHARLHQRGGGNAILREDTDIYKTAPLCEVIGTHAARRTFVVHALEEGMSPEMVMTFTGHTDYDTMKPYIALTDKKRQSALLDNFKMR